MLKVLVKTETDLSGRVITVMIALLTVTTPIAATVRGTMMREQMEKLDG